jgi:hypothetical protein
MPTRLPRHTITETPPVERALRRLRQLRPGQRIDFKELVMIGAREKATQLEAEADKARKGRAPIDEFLALRADEGLEPEAGLSLHESGWVRDR